MSFSDVISVFLLAAMAVVSFLSVRYGLRLLKGRNRRRMFAPLLGTLCDGVGQTGLSAICLDIGSADTVAGLLTVEYERYEAIVVVDSARSPELLDELVLRYALVSVDYRRSPEFAPAIGVRRLYRSRRRRFRRLAVVDTASISPETDADAAADIAVYNYITVIRGDVVLLPGAVERIVAEISSSAEPPHEVHTEAGVELTVHLRDDVAEEGGFASGARHFCRRSERRSVYETLAVSESWGGGVRRAAAAAGVLAVVAGIFSLLVHSIWPAAALAATAAVVASSVIFCAPFAAPHLEGRRALGYSLCNFCEKLLLKISQ